MALQGRWKEAIESANRTLEIDPQYAGAYFIRAMARQGLNDPKGAAEDARRSIQLGIDEPRRSAALRIAGSRQD